MSCCGCDINATLACKLHHLYKWVSGSRMVYIVRSVCTQTAVLHEQGKTRALQHETSHGYALAINKPGTTALPQDKDTVMGLQAFMPGGVGHHVPQAPRGILALASEQPQRNYTTIEG